MLSVKASRYRIYFISGTAASEWASADTSQTRASLTHATAIGRISEVSSSAPYIHSRARSFPSWARCWFSRLLRTTAAHKSTTFEP